ncbi:MAG: transporter substrate-binding protein [Paracoccaceae bacterium]
MNGGKRRIELGLLYSRSGGYSLISEASRTGALAAIAAVNGDPSLDLSFAPVERDPGGNADAYGPSCDDILRNSGARHVIGCVTSWSRKEVIPVLERHGGTLWYPLPYEGFEASDHVVYTHACPNQHLLPLLDWAMPAHGRRAYLTGSNYIWGWEMNRLAREYVTAASGEILGERYLPLGSRDVGRMVEEIRHARPAFVLNNLVGTSTYEFLEAMHRLAEEDNAFAPQRCPILSCNLTEAEFPALKYAADGLVAAGPYFRGATGWPGSDRFASSHEAAAYAAVRELARMLNGRPGAEELPLGTLLQQSPGGVIDAATHHTSLPVLIARVEDGAFRTVKSLPAVAGDPYLTRSRPADGALGLRVVS